MDRMNPLRDPGQRIEIITYFPSWVPTFYPTVGQFGHSSWWEVVVVEKWWRKKKKKCVRFG